MQEAVKKTTGRIIIKKCHVCGHFNESFEEPKRCKCCKKAFLPANYFAKVHATSSKDYEKLFMASEDMHDDDLIKGLSVLW